MTREVERVDQSDMALSRRDLMGSSAVVAAGALGVGMVGTATAQDGPTDEISGTVTDTDGNSVEGATVVSVPHDSSLDALVTTTDANGAYSFQSGDLHPNSNLYHVVARDGTEADPFRSQQNYPFIAAVGETTIPDEGDLHSRYDWTEASGTSSVTDQTGNGRDLSGTYTGPTASINGNQAGEFDGVDDVLSANYAALSQPNHFFAVYRWQESTSGPRVLWDSTNTSNRNYYGQNGGNRRIYAGNTVSSSSANQSAHVVSVFFDGSTSHVRIDGSQVLSGDAGSQSHDGITVGRFAPSDGNYSQMDIGELLVYPMDKTSVESDVEQYLADKWGVTL